MTIPDLRPAEIERFWSRLRLGGCGVLWDGPVNNHGYGRFEFYRGGRRLRVLAHRLAYKMATGEDPGELVVRHQCDTPACCTPDCFLLGTQADNVQDAIERGRWNSSGLQAGWDARDAGALRHLLDGRKPCSRCKSIKPFSEFHRATRNFDGRAAWCKKCRAAYHAAKKRGEAA